MNPKIYIIGRADTVAHADELLAAGADCVYLDVHEFGFSAAKTMAASCYGMRGKEMRGAILRARERKNPYFTGEFAGDLEDDAETETFAGCTVARDIPVLADVLSGCRVISWRRGDEELNPQDASRPAQTGDDLVIRGDVKALYAAREDIESPEE